MTKATTRLSTAQSINSAIKSICDIMRRSNCAGAWILFLCILDEREEQEEMMAEAVGQRYAPSLCYTCPSPDGSDVFLII